MGVMFCRPEQVTPDVEDFFDLEAHIASELGFAVATIPVEAVVHQDFETALRHLPPGTGRRWLLRSWMLSAEEYAALYDAILEHGDALIVSPPAMERTTYMPHYLPLLEGVTPESRWSWGEDIDAAWEVAQELGPPPWIVKDHVKSAKELWSEACFVPEGATRQAFGEICAALIDARGDRFERGIVIRRFVELARIYSPEPGTICHDEWRLIFWQGALVAAAPYFPDARGEQPDLAPFERLGAEIDSPFFAMDIARLNDPEGGWIVIELNDGGVVGLPEQLDPTLLYEAVLGGVTP